MGFCSSNKCPCDAWEWCQLGTGVGGDSHVGVATSGRLHFSTGIQTAISDRLCR